MKPPRATGYAPFCLPAVAVPSGGGGGAAQVDGWRRRLSV